jgi:integrase
MAASRKGRTIVKQQQQVSKKTIYPVTEGLKSEQTKKQYKWHFETFLKWVGLKYAVITPEKLLEFDREELERLIIEYLKYLHQEKHLKPSSINSSMCAIFHFCRVNAFWLNKDRISMFVPEDEDHTEDRSYTRTELEKLIKASDARFRVVFLLLANGLRVGAIPELLIGDLKAWPLPTPGEERPQKVYQILVYNRSKKGRYYTFVTPECTQAVDDYLAFRKKNAHEDITNPSSPLIREQFPLYNHRQDAAIPKKISQSSLEKIIERTVKKAGLSTKGSVMLTHGCRKFAITMMKKAKVDFSDREFLVGHRHSRGLDVRYDKTSPEDRLLEWSKAINLLTIDPVFHLKGTVEFLEGEQAQKIERLERELGNMQKLYNKAAQKLGLSTEFDKDGFLTPPGETR